METYNQKITIKSWAEEDRPREKLLTQGRRNLSDAELTAILIGSGNREETAVELSRRILHSLDNDLDKLGRLSVNELSKFKGIGEAKAITIIAALELGRRRRESESQKVERITGSRDVFTLMSRYFADLNHEEFWIVLLSRANNVLSRHLISKGGQSGTIADPKIIFQTALENHAASMILSHNHPSGNLKPSQADIHLTRKLCEAGSLLDMPVLDHLIFANQSFFSFADEGMM
ncbi:DNA replication and repair protein RadC [Arcticibacter tournemirensis]|uniref:DNA repair protein RadC n=1 Tax=Arcticibacter tournemirensis TaxID=699437 RepID=A0A5M9GPA8_9SPHI|nr:DNA repair protein RadC [Arcticibacter tournemirensis]KAA8476572.1 DNA repair protein RadC [Arcticibacter tournemirensis]TQM52478.1 DNA replication and repair protein RadC [Arcticibacter tournemirensis]